MTYLIIADADENNKPTKVNIKETKAEADAIVEKIKATGNTKVFAIETPDAKKEEDYMTVDFINKTVSYNQTAKDAEVNAIQNKENAKASGNQKLLDLGLTQAEATALTGYTPPVAE
jgi:hypothetical protein